jgi:hypothetical protein
VAPNATSAAAGIPRSLRTNLVFEPANALGLPWARCMYLHMRRLLVLLLRMRRLLVLRLIVLHVPWRAPLCLSTASSARRPCLEK